MTYESPDVTIQMKANEQYFPVVLFIVPLPVSGSQIVGWENNKANAFLSLVPSRFFHSFFSTISEPGTG